MTQIPTSPSRPDAEYIDDIINLLSHDLRAPVRALVEVASWIEDDLKDLGTPLPPDFQSHADLLRSRASRLQALIHDLSSYARIGMPGPNFDGDWGALFTSIHKAVPALDRFDLNLTVEAVPKMAQADLTLLLVALLSNATLNHDRGRGSVGVDVAPHSGGVRIIVTDDGPGIPVPMRDRVVGILTTLQSRDTTEGSGMGLAAVRRIANHYGATLAIGDPAVGTGCAVTIDLPQPD